jgi:hypothetical protein
MSEEKKLFYCEVCDAVSPKLTTHLTHDRSSGHIQSCMKYKKNLLSNKEQLIVMSKILHDKMGIKTNNMEELAIRIIDIMVKQRLTSEQIKEARKRKQEKSKDVGNTTSVNSDKSDEL